MIRTVSIVALVAIALGACESTDQGSLEISDHIKVSPNDGSASEGAEFDPESLLPGAYAGDDAPNEAPANGRDFSGDDMAGEDIR